MNLVPLLLVLSVLLSGCVVHDPAPQKQITPQDFVAAIRASAEATMSAKLVASIAAGDSGLFSSSGPGRIVGNVGLQSGEGLLAER
jgi:hypothetical protein